MASNENLRNDPVVNAKVREVVIARNEFMAQVQRLTAELAPLTYNYPYADSDDPSARIAERG